MINSMFGDRRDEWIRALLPFLFRRPLRPNVLSVLGALLSLVAAAVFPLGWFAAGGILILCAGFFDLVDGAVARHHGISTRFGAFLDSTLDRLADMAVLVGIAMYFALAGEPGHVLLASCVLVASVLVSYAKARAELLMPALKVGVIERGERVVILAVGALLNLMVAALWVLAIGSTITVIQRFARAYREMERIDESERAGLGEHT